MGKKRIIQKTKEELIKEREQIDAAVGKEPRTGSGRHQVLGARIYISSSYNNTLMTLCDNKGNTISQVSAGSIGFKGSKKSTPFAASKVAEAISQVAKQLGIINVEVLVKGVGSGRDSAIRSLAARGLEIDRLKDMTPIPHNGCRRPKVRRV